MAIAVEKCLRKLYVARNRDAGKLYLEKLIFDRR